tara:strand:+ start:195 stop:1181 length:987 start_codon:yes stop_codon:yes gene_type:complete
LVVGFGSIGKRHMNNLLHINKNCQIVIYSKRKDLKKLEGKNVKIFDSLEKCLSEKPDIGFITNETVFHVPTAKKLAESGLDLFIEKPLSNSMKNVKDLAKIVKEKKIITLMGCNLRFDRCIKKIKSLIKQKTIGKIISVKVECGTYLPDWHPYGNYSESYAGRDDLGGGVVLTCIHEIDYLYWFFGEIKEVFSITGKFSDLKIKSSDLSAIILKFKNGIIGEVHLDYFQRPELRSCKIIGTKGTIYWNSLNNEVKIFDVKKKKWIRTLKVKNYDKNKQYVDELSHFLNCVRRKEKPINGLIEGIKILKIALNIIKSSKEKKLVKITSN